MSRGAGPLWTSTSTVIILQMDYEGLAMKQNTRLSLSDYFQKPGVGPLLSLLLACIFFATQSDRFLTGSNFSLIIQQVSVVGALAIGQTLVILTGGIDLATGQIMALAGVFMASLAMEHGVDPLLAILISIGICIIFGILNGFLVTMIKIPPFIVTLGTTNIAFAITHVYATTTINELPRTLTFFGETFKIGSTAITYGSILMLVMFVIAWWILGNTSAGRKLYAVGDNPEAARLAGIDTKKVLLFVYIFASIMSGIAALLLVARTGAGDPNAGQNSAMESITAVVLGGTSFMGGRGNVLGTLVGALIVGVFRNGLQLMGIPSVYQVLITGVLVILAVSVDQLSHRGK
jgi:fructose transport system permease protein